MTVRGLDKGQKAALVMMECQVQMIGEDAAAAGAGLARHAVERGMIDNIAALAAVFRARRLPVMHCLFLPRRDMAGTSINSPIFAGSRWKNRSLEPDGSHDPNPVHPKLGPEPEDFVLSRAHGLEAFHDTELDALLRNQHVETVVLCGVSTNIGIPGTALGGLNRGYTMVVPEDCTAGAWQEAHDFSINHTVPLLATVTSSPAVLDALRSAG
jgi:nicotinamidase-related amidase